MDSVISWAIAFIGGLSFACWLLAQFPDDSKKGVYPKNASTADLIVKNWENKDHY